MSACYSKVSAADVLMWRRKFLQCKVFDSVVELGRWVWQHDIQFRWMCTELYCRKLTYLSILSVSLSTLVCRISSGELQSWRWWVGPSTKGTCIKRGGLHLSQGSRNLRSRISLKWTLLLDSRLDSPWRLGSQILFLSGKWQDLAGKWCHISASSCFHTLDPNPSVHSLDPKFCSHPIRSLDFGVSLLLDPDGNPPKVRWKKQIGGSMFCTVLA